jgi:hypothetical protein
MADGYLSDLIGVHDVRDHADSLMPRRNVLAIHGGTVRDVPASGETQVRMAQAHDEQVVETSGANVDITNVDADVYVVTEATSLRSLGAPITGGRQRVWIVNGTGSAITPADEAGAAAATSRFTNPSTLTIAAGLARLCLRVSDRWLVT